MESGYKVDGHDYSSPLKIVYKQRTQIKTSNWSCTIDQSPLAAICPGGIRSNVVSVSKHFLPNSESFYIQLVCLCMSH